jgi:hypothetical protein
MIRSSSRTPWRRSPITSKTESPNRSRIRLSFSISVFRTRPLHCLLIEQVVDEDLAVLAIAVDSAHPLLKAVGVPGELVVDHQAAELEVQALPGRVGGDHHLDLIAEEPLLLDPLLHRHPTVDHGHSRSPRSGSAGPTPSKCPMNSVKTSSFSSRLSRRWRWTILCSSSTLLSVSASWARFGQLEQPLQLGDLLPQLVRALGRGEAEQPLLDLLPLLFSLVLEGLERLLVPFWHLLV